MTVDDVICPRAPSSKGENQIDAGEIALMGAVISTNYLPSAGLDRRAGAPTDSRP